MLRGLETDHGHVGQSQKARFVAADDERANSDNTVDSRGSRFVRVWNRLVTGPVVQVLVTSWFRSGAPDTRGFKLRNKQLQFST